MSNTKARFQGVANNTKARFQGEVSSTNATGENLYKKKKRTQEESFKKKTSKKYTIDLIIDQEKKSFKILLNFFVKFPPLVPGEQQKGHVSRLRIGQ